jgi:membrane protein DedA with SNARE-associated domain
MGEWVRGLIEGGGYFGVALLMLIETVFPPVPSEVIMSFAGLEAAEGSLTLWGAILAGTFGAMVGNTGWYYLARHFGVEAFRPFINRYGRYLTVHWKEVERADNLFDRYDRWFVFLGRMMPTIRSLVSVPAGLFGMTLRPFLIWSTLGTLGWSTGLALVGYGIGANLKDVDHYLDIGSTAVIGALVLWYFYRVFTWKPQQ